MEEQTLQGLDFSHLALTDLIGYATTLGKNIIIAVVVFIVGKFIIKRLISLMKKIMIKRHVEPSLYTFADSFVSIALNIILLVMIISILGIETSSFVALFASAGMAIGMALSGTLQNFAGGVMVMVLKPYRVGDYIEAAGYAGTVKKILMFNTQLTTIDNQTIIIPNGVLSTGSLKNYSTESMRRVDLPVEVAYGSNTQQVKDILMQIATADKRIIQDNPKLPITIPMTQMAASSIIFELRVWVKAADYWDVRFTLNENVYNTLNKEGIQIPFQQVDVHLKS